MATETEHYLVVKHGVCPALENTIKTLIRFQWSIQCLNAPRMKPKVSNHAKHPKEASKAIVAPHSHIISGHEAQDLIINSLLDKIEKEKHKPIKETCRRSF